jgi:cytochrome c553
VPKSTVDPSSLMRLATPADGTEPLGNRIVELGENDTALRYRDSHSGYVAYVPIGSIGAGKVLVNSPRADGMPPCASCHGAKLTGLGDIPAIAGRPPTYLVRQLWAFQSGDRAGVSAAPMELVAATLTADEMLAIAAYLASLAPD